MMNKITGVFIKVINFFKRAMNYIKELIWGGGGGKGNVCYYYQF